MFAAAGVRLREEKRMDGRTQKADYGVDAPGVIRNLFLAGIAALALSRFLPSVRVGGVTILVSPMFRNMAIGFLLGGVLMLLYSKFMKFGHRDRMLRMVNWRGDERVLDVGTGAGLLLIRAAKKLTTGKATGVDVWSLVDLSGNARERTLRNAEIGGVKEKVEVLDGDGTEMKFADGTFDVVVSNLVIHNIPSREGRDKACREIARVLKPGGTAVISDFVKTRQFQSEFEKAGLQIAPGTGMSWSTFPPIRIIKALKPRCSAGYSLGKRREWNWSEAGRCSAK
jgi:SAM-dependent methyltransferase